MKKELEIKRERRQAEHGTLHCLSMNLLWDLCPCPRARVPAAAGVVALESGKHGETDGAISPLTCPWMGCGKDSYPRSATIQLHRHTCCSTELTTLSETPLVGVDTPGPQMASACSPSSGSCALSECALRT